MKFSSIVIVKDESNIWFRGGSFKSDVNFCPSITPEGIWYRSINWLKRIYAFIAAVLVKWDITFRVSRSSS